MAPSGLKIGELATRAGVNAKTIRFYEALGVLPPPIRASNNYRIYGNDAVDMLQFIRLAQGLGLTLGEIKEIVAIRKGGQPPCEHVYRLLQDKAAELDRKLRDLRALRRRIGQSLAAWGRRPRRAATVCPHIEATMGPPRQGSKRG
jgi:DNA-binding transcriptional MerR regulator